MTPIHIPRAPKRSKMAKKAQIDFDSLPVVDSGELVDEAKTYFTVATSIAMYRGQTLTAAIEAWATAHWYPGSEDGDILFITQYTAGVPLTIGDC